MVEQDVVPYVGALEAIEACPQPWCGYGYNPNGGISSFFCNLGCTKVSWSLICAVEDGFRGKRWSVVDAYLSEAATRAGYRPHRHVPNVPHRGTRHLDEHWLGNDYIELDAKPGSRLATPGHAMNRAHTQGTPGVLHGRRQVV